MNPFKADAEELRNRGYSYSMIQEKLGVPKSTLNNWLASIPFKPNQEALKKIKTSQLKSALFKHTLRLSDIAKRKKEAIKDVGRLTKRDLFMLGVGLYLGEGSKAVEEIKIANSDPMIIKSSLKWLMQFCNLQLHHFRITLHTYPDINNTDALQFWSKETTIPITQFTKTVIDTRSGKSVKNKNKLQYGTAHLYVRSGGTIFPGVKSLHRKIMGWIENVKKQI